MIRHYYHVNLDEDGWPGSVEAHMKAMSSSHLTRRISAITVGYTGGDKILRDRLRGIITRPDTGITIDRREVSGGLGGTLRLMKEDSMAFDPQDKILFAHAFTDFISLEYRNALLAEVTEDVVYGWKHCVHLLDTGMDVAGSHWLTPEEFPGLIPSRFFAGNFWWATGAHIRALPREVHDPHTWIGGTRWTGRSLVVAAGDVHPGWPDPLGVRESLGMGDAAPGPHSRRRKESA